MRLIVVNCQYHPQLKNRVFDDMEAWDILRSYRHVSVDDKRGTITLECRVTGGRMVFKADEQALQVKPSTFYRVIYGWDEQDLRNYHKVAAGRMLTWEEHELALAQCIKYADAIKSWWTARRLFTYAIMVATEQGECSVCGKFRGIPYSDLQAMITSQVILTKFTCIECRRKGAKEKEDEKREGGVDESDTNSAEEIPKPDGHTSNDPEAKDRGLDA